jgi:Hemerythrin HHE cation binding domain
MAGPERRDVISVLTHDHREVEELFGKLKGTTPDDGLVRRELIDQVIVELVGHSVAEEMYLYPATRENLPGDGEVDAKEIADLSRVESTLKALEETDADTEEFSYLLAELIDGVRLHVREEEERLFPALAGRLSPAELTELGDKVLAAKDRLPTRPHPLTPNRPPLNKLFPPGGGLVERVREHVSGRAAC